ncbi:hypothetical protein GF337_10720 [candidate division KSB1 bacterium]|nr:hypothetical protein [candidate division KSB1 bacterium]
MGNKPTESKFLRAIKAAFPRGYNYLLHQNSSQEINDYIDNEIYKPLLVGHKKTLWGEFSKQLPRIGRTIGWVPENIPLIFFNQTVLAEIADSAAIARGHFQSTEDDFQIAYELLDKFEMLHFASRNPFFLSEGETKIVWLITQWAKQPEYLVIGNLKASLSKRRYEQILQYLNDSDSISKDLGFKGPTFILGVQDAEIEEYQKLLTDRVWRFSDATIFKQNDQQALK